MLTLGLKNMHPIFQIRIRILICILKIWLAFFQLQFFPSLCHIVLPCCFSKWQWHWNENDSISFTRLQIWFSVNFLLLAAIVMFVKLFMWSPPVGASYSWCFYLCLSTFSSGDSTAVSLKTSYTTRFTSSRCNFGLSHLEIIKSLSPLLLIEDRSTAVSSNRTKTQLS